MIKPDCHTFNMDIISTTMSRKTNVIHLDDYSIELNKPAIGDRQFLREKFFLTYGTNISFFDRSLFDFGTIMILEMQ